MTTNWDTQTLLTTSSAYWRGCTLQAGVRLEIFTLLAGNTLSLADIAERTGTDRRGMEFLLNGLSAMGLLIKNDDAYSNSAAALELLRKDSPRYLGHIILHHHHILDGWAQLDTAVKTGAPVTRRSYGTNVERESFLMGMFNLANAIAPTLARQIDLAHRRHLLDLGGGPGTYAIHFCLANPALSAVIFDRRTTEPFARKTVAGFGLSDRIDFHDGDFTADPITGGPYDVAWLSHILHSNGPQQCREMIAKTLAVMEPGGLILIHDFILENTKDAPEFAALFALNMLVGNPHGRTYSEEEITAMLRDAGARDIKRLAFRGPNASSILVATA